MEAEKDTWLLLMNGEIREADIETLRRWADRRYIGPQTRVKQLDGEWVRFQDEPALQAILPVPLSSIEIPPEIPDVEESTPIEDEPSFTALPAKDGALGCINHPELQPRFVCRACRTPLCKGCAKYANMVPLCPLCGYLCTSFDEVQRRAVYTAGQQSGFGLADFSIAVELPLRHLARLSASTLYYTSIAYVTLTLVAFFLVPYWFARDRPGLLLGPLLVLLLPAAFQFSFMSQAIRQIARGNFDEIAPDFTESLVDAVGSRALLVAAILLVTFGPAVLVAMASRSEAGSSMVPLVCASIWAIAYLPMALLVAGFSESASAVLNPSIGLKTISRMGIVYIKAFGMFLAVFGVETFLVGVTVKALVGSGIILIPPLAGLILCLPVGLVGFYLNLVIAGILGLSLFKTTHRLGIPEPRI